ncbi:substrate-binding domain-containing protein [Galbibacter sp. EGI 63066]|uniref:hybrid sensor histidine kinase/response regulator transcription factor n=1 Tax=Galbibacter sp. EGI 63066 TaxID=2993559 RepID=UPI002248846B|nr:substrate-binding domain-containing protein [Galbibacter sp. EGI 63066]MCX2681756.1 substrate-binding domain-containing protein [Galbibacter sp. EGI 63066]
MISLFCSCSQAKKEGIVQIGFSQAMTTDDWRKQMNKSMMVEASMHPEAELKILDANDNVNQQIEDLESLIEQKVDVIIVSPIQSKPLTSIISRALQEGIPTIVIDRKVENENYTAYLGADNIEVGRNAGKYIISNSNTSKRINVVEVKGLKGSSPAYERSLGFKQILAVYDSVNIVGSIDADWERTSVKEPFKRILEQGSRVDYVFAHNDRMALSAWEVARNAGLEKQIKFIGVDGLNSPNGGIQLVDEGILNATIFYPTGGNEAIKLALRLYKNQSIPKNNILNTIVIDKLNAEIMKNQLDKIDEQQESIQTQLKKIKSQEQEYYTLNNLFRLLIFLLIIVLGLALFSIYSASIISRKKKQLEVKNKEITSKRNKIEKIASELRLNNEAKVNFFTGISHEFKTPLTLILSSVESINDEFKSKNFKARNEVNIIYNNSRRLLRLINQLLDFRKAEEKKFLLRASKTNLYNFTKHVFNDFKNEARKRNITFTLDSNCEDLDLYMDRNLMDKVYFNLLSNAFKFTPNNGNIKVSITDKVNGNFVTIKVKDSGIGIPEKDISKVFKPFFKGSNNSKSSSGIGLHLSKQFIELHKGKIEVTSKKGSEFSIILPKGADHLSEKDIVHEPETYVSIDHLDYDESANKSANIIEKPTDTERYTLLLIEDNVELTTFLQNKFSSQYDIYTSDGTDGIKKALDLIPDLILCDINLPDKSGFEICNTLKKDLRTSHIPTIILTALSDQDSYVKGLESGVDLYLTKPFSYKILSQSIKSLLYNREKLRYYYTNNIHKIGDKNFGSSEQEFLFKLNKLINEYLGDPSFTVEDLASQLNLSRVQLYRKVKALLGISVSDYINNIKLEKAKEMLKTSGLNISEIAYAIGFSSPNYFSTAFKNKYGLSPKEYKQS